MADTSFTDTSATAAGTRIVAAWLNAVDQFVYQGRSPIFATTTGSANAQVLTLAATSLYSTLTSGDTFIWRAGFSNSGSMTLQIVGASALTAKTVCLSDASTALSSGMVVAGGIYITAYQSTIDKFIMLSMPAIISAAMLPSNAIVTE